jgi:acyl-CoA synthetase (AMP-forming)/AMP-acid ligase II
VVAGAPPPSTVIQQVEDVLGWQFNQIYGLTETAPLVTVNRTREEWDGLSSLERAQNLMRAGVPSLGTRMVTDADGEVLVRSNVVLDGYWQQPEESGRALAGDWFHTGDGGTVGDDGYLTISDRKKDVIITGGENVSSIEVEDALYKHPSVAECAVIGVPDEKWGETIKALVVLRDDHSSRATTEAEVIKHCKGLIAGYKAPTSVEFRETLPRTATGKLQKFKLREPYWEGRERKVN